LIAGYSATYASNTRSYVAARSRSGSKRPSITVIARDTFNNVSDLYGGTITFSTTDPLVSIGNGLPFNYTFLPSDNGVRTFPNGVVLKTAGLQDVTATDVNKAAITGTQKDILVNPAVADHIIMSEIVPDPVTAGNSASFTITAEDKYNNVATGYAGTLTFQSDDPQATLPADYTFDPLVDKGVRQLTTFKEKLKLGKR